MDSTEKEEGPIAKGEKEQWALEETIEELDKGTEVQSEPSKEGELEKVEGDDTQKEWTWNS